MTMMRPQPRRRIAVSASRLSLAAGYRLSAIAWSNSGTPVSCQLEPARPPTLFTSTSGPSPQAAIAASQPASVVRSAATPVPCSSAAARSTSSCVRAATTTCAPSAHRALAIARPMPRLPPVTSAVLFARPRSMPGNLAPPSNGRPRPCGGIGPLPPTLEPMTTSPRLAAALSDGDAVQPRQAGSVLVVQGREPWRVLMMRRPREADFAAGVYVFPGGSVHAEDGDLPDPVRGAALRELFEEVGILLARTASPARRFARAADAERVRDALGVGLGFWA